MVERKEEEKDDNVRDGERGGGDEGKKEDILKNLKENSEDHKDRISIKTKEREHWSSYYGFIFAAIGAAVGIGNIWRYPYVVGTNGGGAFLLTYLIVVFTFGLAFMVLELIVGRYYQKSIILSLGNIKNSFKYLGIFIVIVTFAIVSYYLVILGWILSYFGFSLIGIIDNFSFDDFTNSYYPIVAYMAVITINYLIIRTDISKGIEKISKIGVLLLIAIIIPLSIFGILTPGSDKGIEFYLKPDFPKLADPSIWSVALGQAFFSLSIGMGVLVTYGSYIQKQEGDRNKIVKKRQISLITSSSIVIISDILIAFLAGLMVFSFVFAEDMDPTHGSSLVFRVMPAVFSNIGEDHHGSIVIAPLFFFLLLLAGITSSISMLQVPVSSLQDSLNMTKNRAALIISLLVFAFGMPSALSYSSVKLAIEGVPFLDAIDYLFGTHGLAIAAALFAIAVTWFMDKKLIMYQANLNGRIKFPCWVLTLVKFALPSLIISTIISQIILKS